MTSIEELKDTLAARGQGLRDEHLAERAAAVHGRVRTVQRRRQGGLAAAAALAVVGVVAGAGLIALPRDAEPDVTARALAGRVAPAKIVADGFTYDFDRGIQGTGELSLSVAATDQPRLVTWGSSAVDRLTVVLPAPGDSDPGSAVEHSVPGGSFGDYEFIPPGVGLDVTLREAERGGRLGLALYTLSTTPPAGVSKAGITYREQVTGGQLLGAAIGDEGQDRVTFEITVPTTGGLRFADFCSSEAATGFLQILAGETTVGGGTCSGFVVGVDPGGAGGATYYLTDGAPSSLVRGETVTMTARVQRGPKDERPPLEAFTGRIGLGVYHQATEASDMLPAQVSANGHVWNRVTVRTGTLGDGGVQVPAHPDTRLQVLVEVATTNATERPVMVSLDGTTVTGFGGAEPGLSGISGPTLWPGEGGRVSVGSEPAVAGDPVGAQPAAEGTYRIGFYTLAS